MDFKMNSLHINKEEIGKIYEDGYSGINTKTNTNYKGDMYSDNIFRMIFNT